MAFRPSSSRFLSDVTKRIVYRLGGGTCAICGQPVSFAAATLDHIIPTSRGGRHCYENLQLAHGYCNRRKGSLLMTELSDEVRHASAPKQKKAYRNSRAYRAHQINQQRRAA